MRHEKDFGYIKNNFFGQMASEYDIIDLDADNHGEGTRDGADLDL